MNELVKIEEIGGKQTVDIRDLHSALESKQDFSTWIKNRIAKYGFVEDRDYIRLHKKMEANNATTIEYYSSIEMAKELAMVENNAKGRELRLYFIECEKKAKSMLIPDFSNPAEAARAWADQYEQRQLAEKKTTTLQIELDKEKSWYSVKRVKALGLLPDLTVHNIWRPLKKWCLENNQQIKTIHDANYGDVKTYHADAWNAVYDLDLYFGGK